MGLRLAAIACFAAAVIAPAFVQAQQSSGGNLRDEAIRLRNSGHFAEAVADLRKHLVSYPDDGDATRLLAETLYWMKDVQSATEVSEDALVTHPRDNALRFQYARMLGETGRYDRAREILAPATRDDMSGPHAIALMDSIDSWRHAQSSSWVRINPAYRHDDQPLNRLDIAADLGYSISPALKLLVAADAIRFSLQDAATRPAETGTIGLRYADSGNPVTFEANAGVVQRSFGGGPSAPKPKTSSSDVTGVGEVGFRMQPHIVLHARGERAPYFYTEASLSQIVMTNSGSLFLDLEETHGWQGRAAAQIQQFADDNKITTGYVWFLAPLSQSADALFQVGYSGAYQNADHSRYALRHSTQPYAPSDARFDFSGQYVPYYTPLNIVSHSILAALLLHPSGSATFSASGSYGVRANEDATIFSAGTGSTALRNTVVRSAASRSFHPWTGQASVALPQSGNISWGLAADMAHTAFYTVSGASASLTWKF